MKDKNRGFRLKVLGYRLREIAERFYAIARSASLSPKPYPLNPNQGFALLITLVVVSIVLAISLSLLFVTNKQYLLAVTANESEKAFQAAQIGLECMRFWRNDDDIRDMLLRDNLTNWPPSLSCADTTPNSPPGVQATTLYSSDGGFLYRYRYQYDFSNNRCSETSMYIADVRDSTEDLSYGPVSGEGFSTIECRAGTICTVIFARGYNRPCDSLDSIYTVQREATAEY